MNAKARFKMIILVITFCCYDLKTFAGVGDSTQFGYFKIKDTSAVNLPEFYGQSGYGYMTSTISYFQVTRIYKCFSALNDSFFNKVYRIEYKSLHYDNQMADSLEKYNFIAFYVNPFEIKPQFIFTDTSKEVLWQIENLKLNKAWDITTGDTSVEIAIVDYPFLENHLDLAGNYKKNWAEIPNNNIDDDGNGYVDDFDGWALNKKPFWPFTGASLEVATAMSHGTFVASMAAGKVNNTGKSVGACPNCKIIPVNVLDLKAKDTLKPYGAGHFWLTYFYEGFAYAIVRNPDIINLSWGGQAKEIDTILKNLLDLAEEKGILVVTGSGNDNNENRLYDPSAKFYPASYHTPISVGSLTFEDRKAYFSNYGSFAGTDIMAPGEYLLGAGNYSNSYVYRSNGTSFSTPLIAGIFGLIKSQNPSYTKSQLVNRLLSTADDVLFNNFEYSNVFGLGKANAYKSLTNNTFKITQFSTLYENQFFTELDTVEFIIQHRPNMKYTLRFGDGTQTTTSNARIKKLYNTAGIYSVKLIYKDTLFNLEDSITKDSYILINNYDVDKNSYNLNWSFGKGILLNFSKNSMNFSHDSLNSIYSTGILTPLKVNGFFKQYTTEGTFSKDIIYNSKIGRLNPINGINNNSFIPPVYTRNQSSIIVHDFWSDSILAFQLPHSYIASSPTDKSYSYRSYSLQGTGGITKQFLKAKIGGVDTNSNGSVRGTALIGFMPSKKFNGYNVWIYPSEQFGTKLFRLRFNWDSTRNRRTFVVTDSTQLPLDLFGTHTYPQEIVFSKNYKYCAVNLYSRINLYKVDTLTEKLIFIDSIKSNFRIGSCFSPNEDVLYNIEEIESDIAIVQYNLNSSNINNSKKNVVIGNSEFYSDLRLAPNGIIMVNGSNKSYVGGILRPDILLQSNFTNDCKYYRSILDFGTKTAKVQKYSDTNSGFHLPSIVFDQMPDSIYITSELIRCDSIKLNCNLPKYLPRYWKNGNNWVKATSPVVYYNNLDTNSIQLRIDSLCIKLKTKPIVQIQINNGLLQSEVTPSIPKKLWINSKFKGFTSVNWFRNDILLSSNSPSDTIQVNEPGLYTALGIASCGSTVSNILELRAKCLDTFYNLQHFVVGGKNFIGVTNLSGTVYKLTGNNVVNANAVLNISNATLIMDINSKITVNPAGYLNLDNVKIYSCDRWNGIEIKGNTASSANRMLGSPTHGSAKIKNSELAFASIAVHLREGGYAQIENNQFVNNGIHIRHANYPYADLSIVQNNVFHFIDPRICSGSGMNGCGYLNYKGYIPGYSTYFNRYYIQIDSIKNATYQNNMFHYSINSKLKISERRGKDFYINNSENITIKYNQFNAVCNLHTFEALNSNKITLNGNIFTQMNSVGNYNFWGDKLFNENLQINPVYFKETKNSRIENNQMLAGNVGLEFYDKGTAAEPKTLVFGNKFNGPTYGIAAASDTMPIGLSTAVNNYTDTVHVFTECNEFTNNSVAFVGCGNLLKQGSTNSATGNKYYSSTVERCLFYKTGNAVEYNYFIQILYTIEEAKNTPSNNFNLLFNGIPVTNSYITTISKSRNLSCTSNPNYSSIQNNLGSNNLIENILISPNPTTSEFILSNNERNIIQFELLDVAGKLIFGGFLSGTEEKIGHNLKAGIYFLNVKINGESKTWRLVKI